ncbi:LysR family transcriptional regulator [Plantibacter sp. YIM 135249]|uniref:LysR family transcriptional regulator n=1 Tax=Plantibacter sp. YIM 135249 TaxID=3423918 RepID=UPI003D32D5A3
MIDPELLETFLVVARTDGFSSAARELGLRQSTVSGHIMRLEGQIGKRLFDRDPHRVELTPDGQALVGFARTILDALAAAEGYFESPDTTQVTGSVRFGASEDLVAEDLPHLLLEFRRAHPRVDLELRVGLSETLLEQVRTNHLDLVFIKRRPGEQHGTLVFDDELVWAGRPDDEQEQAQAQQQSAAATGPRAPEHAPERAPDTSAPVNIVTYPLPSLTRQAALAALDAASLGYRITCVTDNLLGLRAAALAGLGNIVHARSLLPSGLVERTDLPSPGRTEFVLVTRPGPASQATAALSRLILENRDRIGHGSRAWSANG